MSEKFKYAIIKVKENEIGNICNLLVPQGYSDIAFVSHLGQVYIHPDPNVSPSNASPQASFTNLAQSISPIKKDSKSNGINAHFQDNNNGTDVSQSTSPISPPEAASAWSSLFSQAVSNGTDLIKVEDGVEVPTSIGAMDALQVALMTGIPPALQGGAVVWPGDLTSSFENGLHHNRKVPYQQRMKGWQRIRLTEALKNGFPTGDALQKLCSDVGVTEVQVRRFFKKRKLAGRNPVGRRPTVNGLINVVDVNVVDVEGDAVSDEEDEEEEKSMEESTIGERHPSSAQNRPVCPPTLPFLSALPYLNMFPFTYPLFSNNF